MVSASLQSLLGNVDYSTEDLPIRAQTPINEGVHLLLALSTPTSNGGASSQLDHVTSSEDHAHIVRIKEEDNDDGALLHHPTPISSIIPTPPSTTCRPSLPRQGIFKPPDNHTTTIETYFNCEICKVTFSKLENLKKHVQTRHEEHSGKSSLLQNHNQNPIWSQHPPRYISRPSLSSPSSTSSTERPTTRRGPLYITPHSTPPPPLPATNHRTPPFSSQNQSQHRLPLAPSSSEGQIYADYCRSSDAARRTSLVHSSTASAVAHRDKRKDLLLPKVPFQVPIPSPPPKLASLSSTAIPLVYYRPAQAYTSLNSSSHSPTRQHRRLPSTLETSQHERPPPAPTEKPRLPPIKLMLQEQAESDARPPCVPCQASFLPCAFDAGATACRSCIFYCLPCHMLEQPFSQPALDRQIHQPSPPAHQYAANTYLFRTAEAIPHHQHVEELHNKYKQVYATLTSEAEAAKKSQTKPVSSSITPSAPSSVTSRPFPASLLPRQSISGATSPSEVDETALDWSMKAKSRKRANSDPYLLPPLGNVDPKSLQFDHQVNMHYPDNNGPLQLYRGAPLHPIHASPRPEAQLEPFQPSVLASSLAIGPSHLEKSAAGSSIRSIDLHPRHDEQPPLAKRRRLSSPEEQPAPEDQRGTNARRRRKVVAPWVPRRPQMACGTCRTKKLQCSIVQGRDGCERCTRQGLICDLPPAKVQELQYINLEDSNSDGNTAEPQSSTSSASAALFAESSSTRYIPESIGKLSGSDWVAARQAMCAKVCDILAHADSELFEAFKSALPSADLFPQLLEIYFSTINTYMPVVHPATFDPQAGAWQFTLTLICLALASQGSFADSAVIREVLLYLLAKRPDTPLVLEAEQAVLLLSAFVIMPTSGLPSQWPHRFEHHFESLISPVTKQFETWADWVKQEQRTRTAFGFYYINLFRHVLTHNADNRISAPRLAGKRLPAPSLAWLATAETECQAYLSTAKDLSEILVTQALRKPNERVQFVPENAYYVQVALLRQAFVEQCSSLMANLTGQISEVTLRSEGHLFTSQIDAVFASDPKAAIKHWKNDIFALYLLHHTLALLREYPIAVLYELAETKDMLKPPVTPDGIPATKDQELERQAVCLWRAAQIWQAVQSASPIQREQLIVPYALFVSAMHLCAAPHLPHSAEGRGSTIPIHLAAHWNHSEGDLQRWIKNRVKRLPAVKIAASQDILSPLTPETRLAVLEEAIIMLGTLHLPDRAAHAIRDLLVVRYGAERA